MGRNAILNGFTEVTSYVANNIVNGLVVPVIDCSNYEELYVALNTTSLNGVIQWYGTNDPTVASSWQNVSALLTIGPTNFSNGSYNPGTNYQIWWIPVTFRYFRAIYTSYTSGSTVSTTQCKSVASSPFALQGGSWSSSTIPITSGGLKDFHLISAATTNATLVKATPGQVYGYEVSNNSATLVAYLKLYNSTAPPTPGSGTPFRTIAIPANSGRYAEISTGLAFSNGIAFDIVGGAAETDATAVGAAQVTVDIDWF